MLTVILIIVIFMCLVLVHEWGHFVTARRRGVVAEEFGFGFPPRVWSRTAKDGVVYSLNALPLGGFVRLKGEDGEDKSKGSFLAAPFRSQTVILLAGVAMNAIVAFLILTVLCWTGLPGIGGFEPGFMAKHYSQKPELLLTDVVAGTPAAKLGLKYGDTITAADGQTMSTSDQLYNFTHSHAGKQISLTVVSGGISKTVTTVLNPAGSKNGNLGVTTQQIYKLRYGFFQGIVAAAWITAKLFVVTLVAIVSLIIHIPALIAGLFTKSVPAAAQDASGPVGIFFIMQSLSKLGVAYVLLFAANISVALAAFNIFPLPALDGGRWAIIAAQKLTHKRIRSSTEALVHTVGFAALIGLMVIITVYDFRKFL